MDFHAQPLGPALKDLQQPNPAHPAKAVPGGADNPTAIVGFDFIPIGKMVDDFVIAFPIRIPEKAQCFIGKYDTKAECVICPVTLVNGDLIVGVPFFGQN